MGVFELEKTDQIPREVSTVPRNQIVRFSLLSFRPLHDTRHLYAMRKSHGATGFHPPRTQHVCIVLFVPPVYVDAFARFVHGQQVAFFFCFCLFTILYCWLCALWCGAQKEGKTGFALLFLQKYTHTHLPTATLPPPKTTPHTTTNKNYSFLFLKQQLIFTKHP